jgi:predicted amidohydrolase
MQHLKLALIQSDIVWEDIDQNLLRFQDKIGSIENNTDVIVLPEMFNTGFTMNIDLAEDNNGKTIKWLKELAKKRKTIITGSLLVNQESKFYNRMFWVDPHNPIQYYDKRHLFRMAKEHFTISPGKIKKIITVGEWKINLQICYDLRFPVWSKNNYNQGEYDYDILFYIANWPEIRKHAYKSLLIARAIENQAFVVWVNRVGSDRNGIYHSGDSMVIDPKGKIIFEAQPGKEEVLFARLDYNQLTEYRNKFKIGMDWDKFNIDNQHS